jgi:AcrR family transcriptional regulator
MKNQTTGKRQLNKKQSREAILKASRRLFSSVGYENVKIEDIAEKAKVSRATLYNYFPAKESLLTGTLDAVCSQIREEAESARQSGTSAETILFDTFHTLVNFTMKYPALTRRISYLNTLENSSLYQCLQPVYDQITELIDQAIADGSYRKTVPAGSIFETLLGIYYVILNHWNYRYPEDSDIISKKLRSKYDFHLKPYRPE